MKNFKMHIVFGFIGAICFGITPPIAHAEPVGFIFLQTYTSRDNTNYVCKTPMVTVNPFDSTHASLVQRVIHAIEQVATAFVGSTREIAETTQSCYRLNALVNNRSWIAYKGGSLNTSETTSAQYGSKTCTTWMNWDANNKPTYFQNSCSPISNDWMPSYLTTMGGFPMTMNETGKSNVSKDLDIMYRNTYHTASTVYTLQMNGVAGKTYKVKIAAGVSQIYNYSPFGNQEQFSLPLFCGTFTIAGQKTLFGVNGSRDCYVIINVAANSSIDVTPIASVPHYTFDTPLIVSITENK